LLAYHFNTEKATTKKNEHHNTKRDYHFERSDGAKEELKEIESEKNDSVADE
jgi:hypothetical protein